jgi:hypothetical protein
VAQCLAFEPVWVPVSRRVILSPKGDILQSLGFPKDDWASIALLLFLVVWLISLPRRLSRSCGRIATKPAVVSL